MLCVIWSYYGMVSRNHIAYIQGYGPRFKNAIKQNFIFLTLP
jgi:hypothetical protein